MEWVSLFNIYIGSFESSAGKLIIDLAVPQEAYDITYMEDIGCACPKDDINHAFMRGESTVWLD